MALARRPVLVLLAEDDDDDVLLTRSAFAESRLANEIHRVRDGEELLEFLRHRGAYAGRDPAREPSIVLLDLNMPRMDGREALREMKADPALRHLPVVVLTTSQAEEDVLRSYEMGANAYVRKPVTFGGLADAVRILGEFWFEIVELPRSVERAP